MIQPHFDYACSAWYPNLNKELKKKLQTAQNKCIRFCLLLGNREHLESKHLKKINWLNVNDRFKQCLSAFVFKFFNKICPSYMSDIYIPSTNQGISTRNSYLKLIQPFRKTTQGQNCLSYISPAVWNKLPKAIKSAKNINTFKHDVKKHYLNAMLQNIS